MASTRSLAITAILLLLALSVRAQSVGDLRYPVGDLRLPASGLRLPASGELRCPWIDLVAPVKETKTEQRFRLSGDVLFDFDKDTIRPEAEPVLAGLAKRIRAELPGAPVRIEGHTDAKGSNSYNQRLSERRAAALKRWFTMKGGLANTRIITRGLGELHPVAPNVKPDGSDDPVGRQQNRRVEIVVEKR